MSVIDIQRNHKGIQTIVTDLANQQAAGRGTMLAHTDGYVYCIFARNRSDGAFKRRLFMSRSNDGGTVWSTPIQITAEDSGHLWEDDPAAIQLDLGDISSNIGIVYNRAVSVTASPVAVRIVVNKETGAVIGAYDSLLDDDTPTGKKWFSINHTAAGFLVTCLSSSSIGDPLIYQYTNTEFTTNAWAATTKSVFPSPHEPMSLSVKRLSCGGHTDLVMIATYRTALNGRAGAESGGLGMGNLPAGIMLCNVGVSFSSNDGGNWSTSQQSITPYTGTPLLDLLGIQSVADADVTELSDGTLVITYQEAIAPQIITHDTDVTSPSVQLPSGIGNCKQVLYHAAKNSLFIAADDTTNGGVFVVNLTAHTVTRIHTETASGPQIWDNRVVTIDISPDGNLLAVGGVNGIDVIDISNPSISNWDINTTGKALRTASTPALRINPIYRVRWDSDSDTLFFSYADQSVTTCWGGKYILSTDTLTDLIYAGTLNHQNIDFIIRPSGLVSCMIASGHNTIVTTSKTTGASAAATTLDAPDTSSGLGISYDDVNDEYLVQTQSSLIRVSTGLSVLETFSATSTPAAPIDNTLARVEFAGKGIMYEHLHRPTWYSFKDQKPYGHLFGYAAGIGENYNFTVLGWGTNIGNWASYPSAGGAFFVNTVDIGRIRYGFFSYNSATKQLITSGVDFYDACNSNKVGTNLTSLRFPRITRDTNDALYMYFSRMDLGLATNCSAPVIGVVVPDVVKLSLKATIRNTGGSFIQSRARIKKTNKREGDDGLQMRASIRFAQCLKMRARIVPRSSQGMTMKATIYGWQQSTGVTGSFLIRAEQQTSARLRFWVATGYTRARTMQLGAYIVRESFVRCTGRFIISANPTGALNPTFNVVQRGQQSLGLRASIGG